MYYKSILKKNQNMVAVYNYRHGKENLEGIAKYYRISEHILKYEVTVSIRLGEKYHTCNIIEK